MSIDQEYLWEVLNYVWEDGLTELEVQRKYFSILEKELKGEKYFDLETVTKRKKNICTSRSFGKEIKSYERLVEALSSFAGTCAMKLRLEKSCCSNISVFIPQACEQLKVLQLLSAIRNQGSVNKRPRVDIERSGYYKIP